MSNDLTIPVAEDWDVSAAAVRSRDVWALADTGATHSVIDIEVCRTLSLTQQGLVTVLFPQAPGSEVHPTFHAALAFFQSATGAATHDWPDAVPLMALRLNNRSFSAVLGMDVLRQGDFAIKKTGAVVFKF